MDKGSAWVDGECSQTCGENVFRPRTRNRTCTNPAPSNGGLDCLDILTERLNISCNLPNCPSKYVGVFTPLSPLHFNNCYFLSQRSHHVQSRRICPLLLIECSYIYYNCYFFKTTLIPTHIACYSSLR